MCTGWRCSNGCPVTVRGAGRWAHPGEADGGNGLLRLCFMPADTGGGARLGRWAGDDTGQSEGARHGACELGHAWLGGGALNRRGTLGLGVACTPRAAAAVPWPWPWGQSADGPWRAWDWAGVGCGSERVEPSGSAQEQGISLFSVISFKCKRISKKL
jgi:hypothetical protein